MDYNQKKATAWLKNISASLPGIDAILKSATSNILVIGAAVFDLYAEQAWIPPLRRKTGDVDLSVGL